MPHNILLTMSHFRLRTVWPRSVCAARASRGSASSAAAVTTRLQTARPSRGGSTSAQTTARQPTTSQPTPRSAGLIRMQAAAPLSDGLSCDDSCSKLD